MLSIRDLELSFSISKKKLHAVRSVSFDLAPNEILGIVGESGCGKTALAKALVKLHPPHATQISGEVLYRGINLLTLSDRELQKIRGKEVGMIFQDPMTALNPTLKIGTQIMEGYLRHYPQATRQMAKDHALEMLELVGIPSPPERMEEYPHTLSGGTRQRAIIAVALATKPNILIADEPTTALDVTIQAQILELLKQIQKKTGMSIILITHDLSVVASFCDRVLVMYAGKVVESANVYDLFSHPRHPYTKRLLAALPRLDRPKGHPLVAIDGAPPNLFNKNLGCSFCPRCTLASPTCKEAEPLLVEAGAQHYTACHHND